MEHSLKTIERQGLLADAFLKRGIAFGSPCDFYRDRAYLYSKRIDYQRWHGKYASLLGHDIGHTSNLGRHCVRFIRHRGWARLEHAALAKNELAFVKALDNIDIDNLGSHQLIRLIKLAFRAGAYVMARGIAGKSLARYPENSQFRQYVLSLSPPKVITQGGSHNPAFQSNRHWLNDHASEYSGQWVALRNGELLGSSNSFEELFNRIGRSKEILFTRA